MQYICTYIIKHKYIFKVYALCKKFKKCKKSIISIFLESSNHETNFCLGSIFYFTYYSFIYYIYNIKIYTKNICIAIVYKIYIINICIAIV